MENYIKCIKYGAYNSKITKEMFKVLNASLSVPFTARTVQTIVGNTDEIESVPTKYAREGRRVEHGVLFSPNVEYKGTIGNYTVYGEDVPIKSLRGNNGDFSKIRQGIYKATIPTILGGTFVGNLNNN